MKLVTWNVNSLNARSGFVEWYLDSAQPDILCIQELKLATDKVPRELFESRGYHLEVFGEPKWNGVAIASRWDIHNAHAGLEGADEGQSRLLAVETNGLKLVNLYCPQGQRVTSPKFPYKLGFYDGLIAWLSERYTPSDPLVVLGDLNIAPAPEDIWNPQALADTPSFHPLEHERWARLVALGLHDAVKPYIEPGQYSFWDYRGGDFHKNKGMRIDHILVTETLKARVTGAWIDREARKQKTNAAGEKMKASDHAPVGIVLE